MRLGGGSVRINVFPDASTTLPKLDIELFHFFGCVNMYVNLVPRANLARATRALRVGSQLQGSRFHLRLLYLRSRWLPAIVGRQDAVPAARLLVKWWE